MRKVALFALVVVSFVFAGCQMQTARETPIDPAHPPQTISVVVKSVEVQPENIAIVTRVVFVWRGIVSDPVFLDGDERGNLRVGQRFADCPIAWGYTNNGFSYAYQLAYLADGHSSCFLFFPKDGNSPNGPER